MTRALPFTEAGLARAIRAIERAGKFVLGVRPDGTLIVGEAPLDPTCLAPPLPPTIAGPPVQPSKWEDEQA